MLDKNPKELTQADLERLYSEAESCDKRLFSEMRTNLQLVAGEHYVREGSRYWNRIRDTKEATAEQRLRLVKNHIQRVVKTYENSIQAACPGVTALPKDEKDMHHQKAAEQHAAVIGHWKTQGFDRKVEQWIKNFFELGEVATKVFWDADEGEVLGYEQVVDEFGQPTGEEKPIHTGKLCFESIPGYLLKRDPAVGSMEDSEFILPVKMISKTTLRAKVGDDIYKKIETAAASFEYTVFDTNTGSYRNTKDQVLYKEIYFRPSKTCPNGYFFHWVTGKIIAKGELPYGIFPIVFEPCEEQTGNPRGISPIRHLRPVQVELNRAASKVAEHQVTLGDDKVYIQSTTRMNQGATLPGIRINTYTGKEPMIVQGRSGEQYFPYIDMQKRELYEIANLEELMQEPDAQVDIYTLLFRSLKYKKKFTLYSDRFERFLKNVTMVGLKLTKKSAHPDAVVPMLGKSEQLNMAEFSSTDDLAYQIKVEPRSDDMESQFGKQIVMNHALQYVGNSLDKEDIGLMLRMSPFLNKEQAFEKFTSKYDSVVNDILAMDRGQPRPARKIDDHTYVMQRLTARMKKPDYEFLPPQVQQLYEQKLTEHEQLETEKLQALKQAQSEFIPSGGYLVAMDFYSADPNDPNKTRRVRVPSESVQWLLKQLESQGSAMEEVEKLPGNVTTDMAAMLGQPQGNNPAATSPGGQDSPEGMNDARNGNGSAGLRQLLEQRYGGSGGGGEPAYA